ncbi:MAG: HAMP domain-containing sensor histidine kinase, partial [Pirellulales bacterium]|nr:HAMP domain-containing sensor histidine kinase [Pirellulales bacterium]
DAFERNLLVRWSHPVDGADVSISSNPPFADREEEVEQEGFDSNGNPFDRKVAEFQYYQPIYLTSSTCVICHRAQNGNPDLSEGDLQAIIKVRIPLAQTQAAVNRNWAVLLATAIITVFLAMILLYVIVRYVIVKPLHHLQQVSEEISRGNTSQRADIQTGDEFEDLAMSFNRMLQQLLDSAEELRMVNSDLDGKVDELAQANMQLFEMNRIKGDFLATMSHELRTPLNSIIGFSDVLASADVLDEKQQRYVRNIQQSGRVLLDMINDTLDLAKIESGRMELQLTDFDISSVVSAQCDMARPLAEKKNLHLQMNIQPSLPLVYQDAIKIRQTLNNLLSNAIKFTPEGGRIDIHVYRDDQNRLVLEISDTGVGIADEDQGVIFEKFRQSQHTISSDAMTREYSGTGLGLSIVKELCRLLGGEISVDSELGKGSTFTVRLPWSCEEQPRLESSLSQELEELTKPPRPDLSRHQDNVVYEPPTAGDSAQL